MQNLRTIYGVLQANVSTRTYSLLTRSTIRIVVLIISSRRNSIRLLDSLSSDLSIERGHQCVDDDYGGGDYDDCNEAFFLFIYLFI